METKKVIKKMILITIFSLIIIFLLQFIYVVPENRYKILDQNKMLGPSRVIPLFDLMGLEK
mgnify:FL=1